MEVDAGIEEAIEEAVRAGVFRRAERLDKRSAATWAEIAEPHSDRATTLLADAMDRLGVCSARPCPREK